MSTNRIVILGCCGPKKAVPAPAHELYSSTLFRLGWEWARSVTNTRSIFALSARYGLIHITDTVAPYSLILGQKGSVPTETIAQQARVLGLLEGGQRVFVAAGKIYRRAAQSAGLRLILDDGGYTKLTIGLRLQWLKSNYGCWPDDLKKVST